MAKNLSVQQFQDLMKNIPKAVAAEMQGALQEQGERLTAAMRQSVPQGVDGRNELLESIEVKPGRHPLQVRVTAGGEKTQRAVRKGVGATYDYAMAQEFGTQHHRAQPFFWPTYRLLKSRIRSGIARRMKAGIEKVVPLK